MHRSTRRHTQKGHLAAHQPSYRNNNAPIGERKAPGRSRVRHPRDGRPHDKDNGGDAPTPSPPHDNHIDRATPFSVHSFARRPLFGAGTFGRRRSDDDPPPPGDFDDMDPLSFQMLSSVISRLWVASSAHHGSRSTLSMGHKLQNKTRFVGSRSSRMTPVTRRVPARHDWVPSTFSMPALHFSTAASEPLFLSMLMMSKGGDSQIERRIGGCFFVDESHRLLLLRTLLRILPAASAETGQIEIEKDQMRTRQR